MERRKILRPAVISLIAILLMIAKRAEASPIVAGFTVQDYETGITDPI